MKNIDDINNEIRIKIRQEIVGQKFSYHGQLKEVYKFDSFWGPGFRFIEDFDLASVATEGPKMVSVKFVCWVIQEYISDSKRKAQVDGQFGPIEIKYNNGSFMVDFESAKFSMIQIS
ncbi:hypothetical protein JW887_03665 [Candidatus Dojkabacteria bacterium]|nr:hypothetical protein [Candidatus Dojkabacteria bacterium]